MPTRSARRAWRTVIAMAALWAATITAARAQDSLHVVVDRATEPDPGSPIFGGLALGFGGLFTGAYIGSQMGRSGNVCDEDCGLDDALAGAAIGETLGLALGVHLGNRSRGNLAIDGAVAGGIWLVGSRVGAALHWRGASASYLLLAIPVTQLFVTASAERASGRARERARNFDVSVIPRRHGAGIALQIALPPIR